MIVSKYTNLIEEKSTLKMYLKSQVLLKKSILKYMDRIANNAIGSASCENISYSYLNKIKDALSKSIENTESLNSLISTLDNFSNEDNNDKLENFLELYNKNYILSMKTINTNNIEIQNTLNELLDYVRFNFSTLSSNDLIKNGASYTQPVIPKSTTQQVRAPQEELKLSHHTLNNETKPPLERNELKSTTSAESVSNKVKPSTIDILESKMASIKSSNSTNNSTTNTTLSTSTNNNIQVDEALEHPSLEPKENVLLISDVDQKVVLPYRLYELKEIMKNSNGHYQNLQQIIDENYTIPMSYYKHSCISRFKEAYTLIRERCHCPIRDAFDLGLELFFKYELNPAIITACKNIDELDTYLSCLEENQLSSFKCFNIVYKCLPTVQAKF